MCDFFHCLHDGAKWGEGVLTIDMFIKENVHFDRNDKVESLPRQALYVWPCYIAKLKNDV